MNHLFSITPKNMSTEDGSIKDAPNGYGVDCGHCHMCEEACIATIWFPPFLWLSVAPLFLLSPSTPWNSKMKSNMPLGSLLTSLVSSCEGLCQRQSWCYHCD